MSANRLKLNTDKIELLWAGLRQRIAVPGHGPAIQLGADTVLSCDHVRLLGVIISADLSFDRHASAVSATSFYWFRQLRRVRRSLDTESAATLVHAFATSRVDYCNLLLAGCNKAVESWTLQRLWWAAQEIRLRSDTAPSFWAALPRCGRSDHVQTLCVSSQSRPGQPVRAVHAGRPSRRTTAPSFGQPPPTRRVNNTARHVRPLCVHHGWSVGLKLTEQRSARSRPNIVSFGRLTDWLAVRYKRNGKYVRLKSTLFDLLTTSLLYFR